MTTELAPTNLERPTIRRKGSAIGEIGTRRINGRGLPAFLNRRHKRSCSIGAAVIAVRRGGEIHAFDSINHFFLISQMIVPGSIYWNFGFGLKPGDVATDEEGLETMKVLGENIAWLLKKTTG